MQMLMRIFVNGLLLTSKRVFTPASTADLSIGRQLCYIGNTRQNVLALQTQSSGSSSDIQIDRDSTLNADWGYFVVSSIPRLANFSSSVFYQYPSPYSTNLLYFRFDSDDDGYLRLGEDYFWNRTVQSFKMSGMNLVQDENKTGICECYGKPMRVFQMQRGRTGLSSQGIQINSLENVTNAFTLEFWILIQDNLEFPVSSSSPQRMLFSADKFVKVGTSAKNLMVSIGDTSQYTSISRVLYYRQWINIAIQLKTNRNVNVFINGNKQATIGQQGTIKITSATQFFVRHDITMKLWRFRLLNNASNSLTDSFFQFSYLQGSNQVSYQSQTALTSSSIVFDFKLEDTELESFTYNFDRSVDGSIVFKNSRNTSYSWNFTGGVFQSDSTTCGDTPQSIDGVCQDNRWYPAFAYERRSNSASQISNDSSQPVVPTFTKEIQSLASQMTIEFWFKFRRPTLSQKSCLLQILDRITQTERFKAEISFNASGSSHSLSVGTRDTGTDSLKFDSKLSTDRWYHLAWQTDLDPIQRAYLFDQQLYTNLMSQANVEGKDMPSIEEATQFTSNSGTFSIILKSIGITTIGNTNLGDSPFLGKIRELRFWNQVRNYSSQISVLRNLEISAEGANRTDLAYYYRMVGQENLLTLTSVGKNPEGDLSFGSSVRPINSPLRMEQDFDLLICPYGSYLSQDTLSCVLPSAPQINMVSFLDVNRNIAIIDSQAIFPRKDQNSFNLAFNLFTTSPFSLSTLRATQSNFTRSSSTTRMEVDMSKVNPAFKYQLQLRVTNKIYQSSYDQYFYQWFDPGCPSFSSATTTPTGDSSVFIFKKVGSATTVALQNSTYCLFQNSFYNRSSISYNWRLAQASPQDTNISQSISYTTNGQSIVLRQTSDLPTPAVLTWNISLSFNNTLLKGLQTYSQLVNFVITQNSINIVYEKPSYTVLNGTNFLMNMTNTYIINSDYKGKTIVYQAICPRHLFVSEQAYNETCVFSQSQKAMLIPTSNYLQKMNVVPSVPYNFTVQAYIDGAKATTLVQKSINVSWSTLTVVGQEGTPSYQQCPIVNLPSTGNITNKVNQTRVLPEYRLTCQVSDQEINYYSISGVEWTLDTSDVSFFQSETWQTQVLLQYNSSLNSTTAQSVNISEITTRLDFQLLDNYLRRQFLLSPQDNSFWLYVSNNATLRMHYGEQINLTAKFVITNQDFSNPQIQTRSIMLTQVSQSLQINFDTNSAAGYESYKYLYSDNIILNFSRSFDPEDPSTKLKANWTCPQNSLNQTVPFCPNNSADPVINITNIQRVQAGWNYQQNITFKLVIYNPKTGRYDDQVKAIIFLILPELSQPQITCPYMNFTNTNPFIWNDTFNSSQLYFTNNITSKDFKLSQPLLTMSCRYDFSSINFDYFALQVYDHTGTLLPKPNTLSIVSFSTRTPSFNFTESFLASLEPNQQYNLTFLLWFRNVGSQILQLQTHVLVLSRSAQVNTLVAKFNQSYLSVMPAETATLDAITSFDNLNVFNRNFSYNWTCPSSISSLGYCPKFNDSRATLTSLIRNASLTNVPGRVYRYQVHIYDNIRVSNRANASILILPSSSPNRDCVFMNFSNADITNFISQEYQHPIIYSLNVTTYCLNTTLTDKMASMFNLNQNALSISLNPYKGLSRNLFTLFASKIGIQTRASNFTLQLNQTFLVANDYANTTSTSLNLTFLQTLTTQSMNDFYISGPSVINLERFNPGLTLQVMPQNPQMDMSSLPVKWICDASMVQSAQSICSNTQQSILSLKFSDLGFQIYKSFFENKIFQFKAVIQGPDSEQRASFSVNFNSIDATLYPESCLIQSNQFGNLNVSQQANFALICNSSEQDYLDSLQVSYQWSIQGIESSQLDSSLVINQSDSTRILRLKPLSLAQNQSYQVKLAVSFPSIFSYPNLLFMQQYNTTLVTYPLLLNNLTQQNAYLLNPNFGFFFQSQFNLSISTNAFFQRNTFLQSNFNGSLNLFAQIRLYDSIMGQWFSVAPLQYLSSDANLSFFLPIHSKLFLDVSNNLGQTITYQLTPSVYNDQRAIDGALLALLTTRLTSRNQSSADPQASLIDLYSYVQLVNRLNQQALNQGSTNLLQKELGLGLALNDTVTYVQFLRDCLSQIRSFFTLYKDEFCYVSATCVRVKQSVLQVNWFMFDVSQRAKELMISLSLDSSKIEQVLEDGRDFLIFFLDELEVLTTDLNQNLADQAQIILNYFSTESNQTLKAQMKGVQDMINSFRIATLAPGESASTGDGDTNQNGGGIFKLPLNKDFVFNSSEVNIFIPKFVVNSLTLQNSPNIPLSLAITPINATSPSYQDIAYQQYLNTTLLANGTQNNSTILKTTYNLTYMTSVIVDIQLKNSKGVKVNYDRKDFIQDNATAYDGSDIIIDFPNVFATNRTRPSLQRSKGAICVFQKSDSSQLTQWYGDQLITRQFNRTLDQSPRYECTTPHLTKFTVIYNSSYDIIGEGSQGGGSSGLISGLEGVLAEKYWYRYFIVVIVLGLLFIFVSGVTYFNHTQRLKKQKAMGEEQASVHMNIMTSENLVANELGQLKYSYSLNRGLLFRQIYLINSTLGSLFVLLKHVSLALRTQLFFLQIFIFGIIGVLYFRFKANQVYYFVEVKDSSAILVDSIILSILCYFILLVPFCQISNQIYANFKPEYFRLPKYAISSHSDSRSLPSSDFESNRHQQSHTDQLVQQNQYQVDRHVITDSQLKGSQIRDHRKNIDSSQQKYKPEDNQKRLMISHGRQGTPNTEELKPNAQSIDFDCENYEDYDDGGYQQQDLSIDGNLRANIDQQINAIGGAKSPQGSTANKNCYEEYENGEYYSSNKKIDGPASRLHASSSYSQNDQAGPNEEKNAHHSQFYEGGESEQNISGIESAQNMSMLDRSHNDHNDSRIDPEPPLLDNFINAQDRLARSQNSNTHSLNASSLQNKNPQNQMKLNEQDQKAYSPNNYLRNLNLKSSQTGPIQFYNRQAQEEAEDSSQFDDSISIQEKRKIRKPQETQGTHNQAHRMLKHASAAQLSKPESMEESKEAKGNPMRSSTNFGFSGNLKGGGPINVNDLNFQDLDDMRQSQRSWGIDIKTKVPHQVYQRTQEMEGVNASLDDEDEYGIAGQPIHLKGSLMSLKSLSSMKKSGAQYKQIARTDDIIEAEKDKFYTFRVQQVSQDQKRIESLRNQTVTLGATENAQSSSHRPGLSQIPNSTRRINNHEELHFINSIQTRNIQNGIKDRQRSPGPSLDFVYSIREERKDDQLDVQNVSQLQPQSKRNSNIQRALNMQDLELNQENLGSPKNEDRKFPNAVWQSHQMRNHNQITDEKQQEDLSLEFEENNQKALQYRSELISEQRGHSKTNSGQKSLKHNSVVLLNGLTPDKRQMEHLDLESMNTESLNIQDNQIIISDQTNLQNGELYLQDMDDQDFYINLQQRKQGNRDTFIEVVDDQLKANEDNRLSFGQSLAPGKVKMVVDDDNLRSSHLNQNPLQVLSKASKSSYRDKSKLDNIDGELQNQERPSQDEKGAIFDPIRFQQIRMKKLREYDMTILSMFIMNCLLLGAIFYIGSFMSLQNMISYLIYLVLIFIFGSILALIKALLISKRIKLIDSDPIYDDYFLSSNCNKLITKLLIGEEILSFILIVAKNRRQLFSDQRIITRELIEIIEPGDQNSSNRPLNPHNTQQFPMEDTLHRGHQRLASHHPDTIAHMLAQNISQESPKSVLGRAEFTKRTEMALNQPDGSQDFSNEYAGNLFPTIKNNRHTNRPLNGTQSVYNYRQPQSRQEGLNYQEDINREEIKAKKLYQSQHQPSKTKSKRKH